ncbi:MAG: TadE family protein [Planctomycetota bacterium]|jgi:Flp pilus assembly protein TadG
MTIRKPGGLLRSRGGQAVVEFALVLPVFALMLFAAIEFGRAYFDLHLLTNAAREGARVGALPEKVEADVQSHIDIFLQGVGMPDTSASSVNLTISVTEPDGTPRSGLSEALEGDRVAVTVSYDFQVLTGSIIPGFTGTVTLKGRCVFRHE